MPGARPAARWGSAPRLLLGLLILGQATGTHRSRVGAGEPGGLSQRGLAPDGRLVVREDGDVLSLVQPEFVAARHLRKVLVGLKLEQLAVDLVAPRVSYPNPVKGRPPSRRSTACSCEARPPRCVRPVPGCIAWTALPVRSTFA